MSQQFLQSCQCVRAQHTHNHLHCQLPKTLKQAHHGCAQTTAFPDTQCVCGKQTSMKVIAQKWKCRVISNACTPSSCDHTLCGAHEVDNDRFHNFTADTCAPQQTLPILTLCVSMQSATMVQFAKQTKPDLACASIKSMGDPVAAYTHACRCVVQ